MFDERQRRLGIGSYQSPLVSRKLVKQQFYKGGAAGFALALFLTWLI